MEGSNELAKAITKKIFEKFDADNSGTIDKAEAKTIFMDELKKGGTTKVVFDEEAFENWFKLADVNGDGSVSFEEAEKFVAGFMMHGK